MSVKQISVFLENKAGRLADVTKVLGSNNIDINAISIADTTHFGILRLIVSNPDMAEKILREAGFTVTTTPVLAIAIEDTAGSLSVALDALNSKQIGVDYIYAFVGKTQSKALVIFRVEDIPAATTVLTQAGITVLKDEEVYSL
ncbi:MAG: ACT domain-containing protein [Ruminococcaceae bacterium]|nr:ACT domain-containing protein [Oscillospiraceae bacterium]